MADLLANLEEVKAHEKEARSLLLKVEKASGGASKTTADRG